MKRLETKADRTVTSSRLSHRIAIWSLASILLVLAGTGCKNTAEGAGDDMEEIGDDIEDAVD
jgi:predicted small secreted protein